MATVTFIDNTGARRSIDIATGLSVMQGAVDQGVPGIDADCGGSCACGTCHVIVDPAWSGRLPPPSSFEEDTLDLVVAPEPGSRLSCQITVVPALDGLVVRTPASQH